MKILRVVGDAGVKVWRDFVSYINVSGDIEPQDAVELSVRSGISFKGSQLLVLIFAIFIASLGLNTNSIPVIIGAMLISPLMGPIIGMGVAIGIKDFTLLRRSLRNICMAVVGSLVASAVYFMISPLYDGASQLLARTTPSIYDVFVALFGGAAGIVSIACRNKGQVMPGVAIATSLMPPLCTAGYGIATLQGKFFFGALYLFFINAIFILFASWIGVKLMGYKAVVYQDEKRARKVQMTVYALVCVTVGVCVFLTVQMIGRNVFVTKAAEFVETQMVFPNTQVLSHKEYIKDGKRYIDVNLIGAALPKDSLQLAMMTRLDSIGLGGTVLNISQGFAMGNTAVDPEKNADKFYALMQTRLAESYQTIDSLRSVIALRKEFSGAGISVAPEVKVLFPAVKDIALSRMLVASVATGRSDTLDMAFVNAPSGLSVHDRKRLAEFLEVRLGRKDVTLSVNPSGFDWPSAYVK